MSNSPLVSYVRLSPNNSGRRTHSIDRITPHCVVGQCSVETLGAVFAPASRGASSNYGIGADGKVGMYCEESVVSWCSSSPANDNRAVTIECASNTYDPFWMNNTVWKTLIKLCVDVCKRNGKKKLLWLGSKEKTLAYVPKSDEMVLSAHRWFRYDKSCPGDWLYSRFGKLAAEVTIQLGHAPITTKGHTATMMRKKKKEGDSTVYYFDGQKIHPLTHPDQLKIIRIIYKDNNGKDMPHYKWVNKAPWWKRLQQAIS